jgi:hypothetical protein
MIREPNGLAAIRRMGAGANIINISTMRCELDLSGSFAGVFGLVAMGC